MVSEFNQWREILPSNMAAGLFIERLLGNKQSRMVERIGSIDVLEKKPCSHYHDYLKQNSLPESCMIIDLIAVCAS